MPARERRVNCTEKAAEEYASTAEIGMDHSEVGLQREARSQRDPKASTRHTNLSANLEQPQTDRGHLRRRPLRAAQPQPPQTADEKISHHRQVQTVLIGSHSLGAESVREQPQLF